MASGVSHSSPAHVFAGHDVGPMSALPLVRARPVGGYDERTDASDKDRLDSFAARRHIEGAMGTAHYWSGHGCGSNPHLNAADMVRDPDTHLPNVFCTYHSPRQLHEDRRSGMEAGRLRDTYYSEAESRIFARDPSLPSLGDSVLLALGKSVPVPALPAGAFIPSMDVVSREHGADAAAALSGSAGPGARARTRSHVHGLGTDTPLGRGVAVVTGVLSAGRSGMTRAPTSVYGVRSSVVG